MLSKVLLLASTSLLLAWGGVYLALGIKCMAGLAPMPLLAGLVCLGVGVAIISLVFTHAQQLADVITGW